MKKDTQRGSAVVNVLRSDSIISVGKEYLELGIDAVLESGALKDIPFVNSIAGIFGAVGTVKDQLLTNKLLSFFSELAIITQEERNVMVDKLNADNQFSGRVGASIIEILDRMESERKPELAAKCFIAYTREKISFDELRRVLFALEKIPTFDIDKVENFAKVKIEEAVKMDESVLLAFVNAGLGMNNGGWDGGAIIPTKLCQVFVSVITNH